MSWTLLTVFPILRVQMNCQTFHIFYYSATFSAMVDLRKHTLRILFRLGYQNSLKRDNFYVRQIPLPINHNTQYVDLVGRTETSFFYYVVFILWGLEIIPANNLAFSGGIASQPMVRSSLVDGNYSTTVLYNIVTPYFSGRRRLESRLQISEFCRLGWIHPIQGQPTFRAGRKNLLLPFPLLYLFTSGTTRQQQEQNNSILLLSRERATAEEEDD